MIAEGDILTLCTRLFTELLLVKYEFALPHSTESLLANHASSLLDEERRLLDRFGDQGYIDTLNNFTLPQSQTVIEAIGHAMAYFAAKQANVPEAILDMYESTVMRQDSAWYANINGISRVEQRVLEDQAVTSIMPRLAEYLDGLGIEKYVSAPIVSDARWKQYLAELPVCTGNARSGGIFRLKAAL